MTTLELVHLVHANGNGEATLRGDNRGLNNGSDVARRQILEKLRIDPSASMRELRAHAANLQMYANSASSRSEFSARMEELRAVKAEIAHREQQAKTETAGRKLPWQKVLDLIGGGKRELNIMQLMASIQRPPDRTDAVASSPEALAGAQVLLTPVTPLVNQEISNTSPETAARTVGAAQVSTTQAPEAPAVTNLVPAPEPERRPRIDYRAQAQQARDIARTQAELAAKKQAEQAAKEKREQEAFVQTNADRILAEYRVRFPTREVTGQELIMLVLKDEQLMAVDVVQKLRVVDRALQLWDTFTTKLQKVQQERTAREKREAEPQVQTQAMLDAPEEKAVLPTPEALPELPEIIVETPAQSVKRLTAQDINSLEKTPKIALTQTAPTEPTAPPSAEPIAEPKKPGFFQRLLGWGS
jgi:hypothetical protein